MMNSKRARTKHTPEKPFAIRVYITDHKEVDPTLKKFRAAAKKLGQSVSSFLLLAGDEKADRVLAE